MDEDLYIITTPKDAEPMSYSDALVVPVNTLHADDLHAMGAGHTIHELIPGYRGIPVWKLVERLEEHSLFQDLVDEYITKKKT